MNLKTGYRSITKSDQDVDLLHSFTIGEHVFRVRIRSSAHQHQSFAVIEVFDRRDLRWNPVFALTGYQMETEHGLCCAQDGDSAHRFAADERTLIDLAMKIVGIAGGDI